METGDIATLITSLMSNPDMMEKIKNLASGLDLGAKKKNEGCECEEPIDAVYKECEKKPQCPEPRCENAAENRRRLIEALTPYLSKERSETAKRLLVLTELIDSPSCPKGRY